jgi:PAS domain S-box-containing protein
VNRIVEAAGRLRLVYLEDDESAFELVRALLAAEGFDCDLVRAGDEASFRAELAPPPDVILADYMLPTIDGMAALEICRRACPGTPFIFVSGALGEAMAIDLLKAGVTDFVLKDALPRLLPAIRRSLAESREHQERLRTERQIHLLDQAIAQSPVGLGIATTDERLVYVNERLCAITGYPREALMGGPPAVVRCGILAPGVVEEIREHLRTGRAWLGDCALRRRDGGVVTVRATFTPIRDAHGTIGNHLSTIEDITEARHDQERQRVLERQLYQAQKMESIGVLTGGIAHDFNNILTGILGFAEIGRLSLDDRRALGECFDEIHQAGMRAKDLVAQILTFSRQGEAKLVPVDLARVVGDAVKFLRASMRATIRIESRLEPGRVRADPTQIHQIVLNLATNALQAIQDEVGTLTFGVERVLVDGALASALPQVAPGPCMCLTVQDTGHGMDADTVARIFDPFFTTKPSGEGTGLGLAVVQGIVRAHHGGILVRSAPGEGSTFAVYLPICAEAPADVPSPPPVGAGRGEHVLIVDDEVSVGHFAGARLEQLAYRVTVFSDPYRAIAALRAAPASFDAVVSDFAMPGLTGFDFVRQARACRADLPAVIITGNRSALAASRVDALPRLALLDKPFTGDDLVRALQSVLPAPA